MSKQAARKTIKHINMIKKIISIIFALNISGLLVFAAAPALADQTNLTSPISPFGIGSSHNWAGYVANSGTYTSVSGSWIIPQPSVSSTFAADATWIGIGGVTTTDLIQVGTQAIQQPGSSISYQAWYEMLPGNSVQIPISVNPGDLISASINEQSANQWLITLKDNTNGQNYQTTVNYNSSMTSAEWIQEMPSTNFGFIPLDNFGTVQFTNGQVMQNGNTLNLSQANAQSMTMLNNSGQALATVSAINPDGASFSVSRTEFTPSTSSVGNGFGRRGWQRVGMRITSYSTGAPSFTIIPSSGQGSFQVHIRLFGNHFGAFRFGRSK